MIRVRSPRAFHSRFAFVAALVAAAGFIFAPARAGGGDWRERARPSARFQPHDEELLDQLQRTAFQFFVEQSHPVTGLVRDRARADGLPTEGKASVAASGFAFSAWAIAAERGWTEHETALEQARLMLRFLAEKAPRHEGMFYHFMEMETGERAWRCELSPIDTALCLAGALVAREYFQDPGITELVDRIYNEVNWKWFLNEGDILALGWYDETGFSRYRWNQYSEHMVLSLLGLGAEYNPLPREYWNTWEREPIGRYAGYRYIQGAPLFIHQFAHAYFDFRHLRDSFADYHHNSVLATLAQRQFCIDLRDEFPSWGERLWGVTASDSATGYKAWGGPPRTTDFNALDGTIVPCAAAGAVAFAPYEAMVTLRHMRTVYGHRIWKRYGFLDAFNPETGWLNPDVIGIDLGITLLQIENARSGMPWAVFMQAREAQRGLSRAGFLSKVRDLPWDQRDRFFLVAQRVWETMRAEDAEQPTPGLRLSSILAAVALGLISGNDAAAQLEAALDTIEAPADDRLLAQYAAGLVTIRQAITRLAPKAASRLEAIDWRAVEPGSDKLGSANRLAVFFKIAAGAAPVTAWTSLAREPEAAGPLWVLAPGNVGDQMLPALWLDERPIITGASAQQLAYALISSKPDRNEGGFPYDMLTTALLLEYFPAEIATGFHLENLPETWIAGASPDDRAAFLLGMANLLASDTIRAWFQNDPLVRAGRGTIAEFHAGEYGENNSILWRDELAGPLVVPPERRAYAVPASTPRDSWPWITMAGLEYKDSHADVRSGDPELKLTFAFTYDDRALYFHATAIDTPAGFETPTGRRGVELFIDPNNDGVVWAGPDDFQYGYRPDGGAAEWFNDRPAKAIVRETEHGYEIEAEIEWSQIGLTPGPGLVFGMTSAIHAGGSFEWQPSLKLNWRIHQRRDERFGIGVLELR